MSRPLVSIICLCYNQERFVKEAIDSVFSQTWPNIELVVVDDASTDGSAARIKETIAGHNNVRFVSMKENVGNCAAFNEGLKYASGEFLIDLAADDMLMPSRVEKGVEDLWRAGDRYGVTFSDGLLISEDGSLIGKHSDRFPHDEVPTGDVYREVIRRYFICSPTVMFKREVIDHLGGYDADLSYEDFDFWVRSSRKFYYSYVPECLVKKRIVRNSLSRKQFQLFSPHQHTTFKVCEKILSLNRSNEERDALQERICYEIRQCVRQLNFWLALRFVRLLSRNYLRLSSSASMLR